MSLIYLITNYLDGLAIGSYTTKSTHSLYIATNLANERPSLPYRTTGLGTLVAPEYVCVDLGESKDVTFAGIFNHNITTSPESLVLKGCASACGICNWAAPGCTIDLTSMPADPCDGCAGSQPVDGFNNIWAKFEQRYRYWRLEMVDTGNSAGYLELGELVLGLLQRFPKGALEIPSADSWVRLSPGRADGPEFFMRKQRTHYGQDWSTYYSKCERFELKFTNQNDPCVVDAVHKFLKEVQQAGGRFVLVPDDTKPFCYYVSIENLRDYADRTVYGRTRELREWRLELKTLTEGVVLL